MAQQSATGFGVAHPTPYAPMPKQEKLGVYGEVAFANVFDEDTDNSWGTKLGAKYSF